MAQSDLARYRQKGPDPTTQILIDVIRDAGSGQGTLLDIGAGIGVIHHELLGAIVSEATHVDVSQAYIDTARDEATRRQHTDQVRFVRGDFVERADGMAVADIVTLDRAVCCYADYGSLLATAAEKCGRLLALSYPRERWFVRMVFWLQNRGRALRGSKFRTFVHPEAAMTDVLAAARFERCFVGGTIVWGVQAFRRTTPPG